MNNLTKPGVVLVAIAVAAGAAMAQATKPASGHSRGGVTQSHTTVRKHRVADDTLVRAEAAMDKSDYTAAEPLLLEAAKSDSGNYRVWFDLGFVYTATGRQSEAIDAYRKSVAAKPDVFESNLNLGMMLARAGDADAEKYLRAATLLKPSAKPDEGHARAWLSLGQVLQKTNPKAALDAFERAIQLRPADPEARLSAALAAEQLKDFPTAEREYSAVAEREPKNAEAIAGLANVYMETSRMDEAEQALRKFLALAPAAEADSPAMSSAHVQLGRVLMALHRRKEAIGEFEKGLVGNPKDDKVQRELAGIYLDDKQYAKAEAAYRQLLPASPKDAELHFGLGRTLMLERKFDEALKELVATVNLKPDLGEAYGELALAASELKNYPLALKALDARKKYLPDVPGTLFLRATVLDHMGARPEASASYREFLAASNGKYPDQEWQARHRLIAIDPQKKR